MPKKTTKETKTLTPAKKTAKAVRKTPAAPAVKPVEPKAVVTTVSAIFDVGFGNTLYIRGSGPGLSWDKGTPLTNVTANKWSVTLTEPTAPVTFKLLINDEVWSGGEDYVAAPGAVVDLTPEFPGW